jgi:p-hydroxybenzoate 3-monooxygenase
MMERTADLSAGHPTVLVIGAGPAGLVLGNLLLARGIRCLILERQSRHHVENRARAGFLAANTVRILSENGLAAGLHANGREHDTCVFRGEEGQFELNYRKLGRGEVHTVYPQQNLVTDLIAEFRSRGGDIRFSTTVTEVSGVVSEAPVVRFRGPDGEAGAWTGAFLAGCDGRNGVSRHALPGHPVVRRYRRDHGISWLAVLAEAPQSMGAVAYATHPNGFAGHMARSAMVTRYYLQCPPGDDPDTWTDQRIWDELNIRMRTDEYGPLRQGPILERRVVDLSSDVVEPMQHGRLFLVGDAAGEISPSAAKGANLAVLEAEILAHALVSALRDVEQGPLSRYSAQCLPRIWRAQEFSHWMINLLHGPLHGPGADSGRADFDRALQRARLASLRDSRTHQDYFAENYVGI